MKKVVSLLLVLSVLCMLAVSLVSCGAPKDDGARIDIYLGNGVYDFDPTDYYADSNAEQVMSLLYEPLFKYQNGKVKCAMAEEYLIDEEERTIVITIRESYWSNNIRVKAADFVYAWSERLLDPANPNPAAALLYDIENALELKSGLVTPADLKVEATDVYELTITYREGGNPEQLIKNLASIATAPIRQPAHESTLGYWSKSLATIVTNGPFRFSSYDPLGTGFTLARNLGYHQSYDVKDYDNEVRPGELTVLTTPLGEAIQVSYEDIEKKVCFYMSDAPLNERDAARKGVTLRDHTSVYTYVFDTNNPLFADANVRKALSLAIDRSAIIAAITYGKAANGFVPDVSGGSTELLISPVARMNEAKALLATVDLTGIDKRFTLTVADDAESVAIADLAIKAWAELGFTVTLNKLTTTMTTIGAGTNAETTFYDNTVQQYVKSASLGNTKFDVIAVDWQTYTDDPFVALASLTYAMNGCGKDLGNPDAVARASIAGWADEGYDALVSKAYNSTGNDRAKYLDAAEAYLCEQMPVIPLVFNQTSACISKDLKKVAFDDFGHVIFNDVKQKHYKDYLEKPKEQK